MSIKINTHTDIFIYTELSYSCETCREMFVCSAAIQTACKPSTLEKPNACGVNKFMVKIFSKVSVYFLILFQFFCISLHIKLCYGIKTYVASHERCLELNDRKTQFLVEIYMLL